MNLGMGTGRETRRNRPQTAEERRAAVVEDPYASMAFRPGSIVATADGTQYRVVGIYSDGAERVIVPIDGPNAGRRHTVPLRAIRLISPPPERTADEAPAAVQPAGTAAAAAGWAKMTEEQRMDRYDRREPVSKPFIVEGDFKPEMFGQFESAPVVLEGGPFEGVEIKVPRSVDRLPRPGGRSGRRPRVRPGPVQADEAPPPGLRPGRPRVRRLRRPDPGAGRTGRLINGAHPGPRTGLLPRGPHGAGGLLILSTGDAIQ